MTILRHWTEHPRTRIETRYKAWFLSFFQRTVHAPSPFRFIFLAHPLPFLSALAHTQNTHTHTHTHTLSLPPSRSFPLFSSPTFLHFFPHLFPALLRPFGFASITYPRLAFSRLDRSYGFWLRLARVPFVLPHPGLVSDSLTRTRSFPRSALLPS